MFLYATMLVLYETALGFCLFKVSDSAKPENADLWKEFESPEKANKLYVCFELHRMEDVDFVIYDLNKPQTKSVTSVHIHCDCRRRHQGGKLGKGLKQFLTDEVINKGKGKESLVVVDQNLGGCAPGVCSSSEFRSAFTQDVRFRRN